MNKLTILKKASLSLTALVAAFMVSSSAAGAIPYNGDNTQASPVPAFNVFTGAPAPVVNEADFLRARVPANNGTDPGTDTSTSYVDPLSTDCTNGKRIQMRVYVHNGASQYANNDGSGPSVAHGTKVKVSLPANQATSFNPSATISANNAATVNDGVSINCNGHSVKLHYIAGTASQYSKGTGVVKLDDSIVTTGVPVRSHQVAGDVWGCWEERVYVVLTVQVEETPPVPQVTATCDLLSIVASDDRKVKVSQFKYTNVNASVKNVVLNFGDNSQPVTLTDANQIVGQTHQYRADGKYTISAVISFMAGDKTITSGGPGTACATQVTYSPNQPPVVTPPTTITPASSVTPSELPNTGAGSVVGMFAAVTAAGAAGYRFVLSRRLSRQ